MIAIDGDGLWIQWPMYEFNGNSRNNGWSNNRNMIPEVLDKSAGVNSMMRMADGNGSQWIGHTNSITAWVASSRKWLVKRERERESDKWNEGGRRKYASCDRWPGDVAYVYAVITKNRRNTVTIIGYHGMSQPCDSNKNSEQPTAVHAQNIYKYERTTSPLHPRYIQKNYHGIWECHMDKNTVFS